MTFWDMLVVAWRDIARTLRRKLASGKPSVVHQISRHDGSGRTWNVEDSGPLEDLLTLARQAAEPTTKTNAGYTPKHRHVAPVASDWMPVIGARRIAATLDDTGVWSRAELEKALRGSPVSADLASLRRNDSYMDPELVEMGAPV